MTALDNAKRAAVLADATDARVVDVIAALDATCPRCNGEGVLVSTGMLGSWHAYDMPRYRECSLCAGEGAVSDDKRAEYLDAQRREVREP